MERRRRQYGLLGLAALIIAAAWGIWTWRNSPAQMEAAEMRESIKMLEDLDGKKFDPNNLSSKVDESANYPWKDMEEAASRQLDKKNNGR